MKKLFLISFLIAVISIAPIAVLGDFVGNFGGFESPFSGSFGGFDSGAPFEGSFGGFDAGAPFEGSFGGFDAGAPFEGSFGGFDAGAPFVGNDGGFDAGAPFVGSQGSTSPTDFQTFPDITPSFDNPPGFDSFPPGGDFPVFDPFPTHAIPPEMINPPIASLLPVPIVQAVREDELSVYIGAIRIPENSMAGEQVPVLITFKNNGDKKLDDLKTTVVVQELGIRASVGPMDLTKGKTISKTLYVELPEDVKPGIYDASIFIDSASVHRAKYRELEVI